MLHCGKIGSGSGRTPYAETALRSVRRRRWASSSDSALGRPFRGPARRLRLAAAVVLGLLRRYLGAGLSHSRSPPPSPWPSRSCATSSRTTSSSAASRRSTRSPIRSRVGGYLDQVHFQDGALVKKGDLLFTIDQRPYQAAYDAAKSQVDVADERCSTSPRRSSSAPRRTGQDRAISRSRRSTTAGASILSRAGRSCRAPRPRCARPSLDLEFTEIKAPLSRPHRPPAGLGRQPGAGRPRRC